MDLSASSLIQRSEAQSAEGRSASGENASGITDELVRQVADQIYARLLRELRYEQERQGALTRKTPFRKGGR
jgi:hypothetical protein